MGPVAPHASLLQYKRDDAGGITVTLGFEWCIVFPLPCSDKRRQAEAAVGLGILIALFRNKETVLADQIDLLKW